MKKVCRNCKKEYDFCSSCLINRPYLQKFCSYACKIENEEKQKVLLEEIENISKK